MPNNTTRPSSKPINIGTLVGQALEAPTFSHITHGTTFYALPLKVDRLSGNSDVLNVLVTQDMLDQTSVQPGETYKVIGTIRSYSQQTETGHHRLLVSFLAREISKTNEPHQNNIVIHGRLCRRPGIRKTPSGRDVCDLMIEVKRPMFGNIDYVRAVAWGMLARVCKTMRVGTKVKVTGRLQSREYPTQVNGKEEIRTVYELSIQNWK